jgi:hypothetical protein
MRRFIRRLFTFVSAVSLLLCVATAVAWVRSYWRTDAVVYVGPSGHSVAQWMRGRICFGGDNFGTTRRFVHADSWHVTADADWGESAWHAIPECLRRLGFAYDSSATSIAAMPAAPPPDVGNAAPPPVVSTWRLLAPLWPFCAVFAVAPLVWYARRSRLRRRIRLGLCTSCGYDLRAHGAGERCPECGAIAT